MKIFSLLLTIFIMATKSGNAQTVTQKLQSAYKQFENDPQLKYAISSLYVIDANTGQVVFDKNSRVGLAPASTQKIITAATAFELLGKGYRYKTELGYDGEITKYGLDGNLIICSSGDPTFGSFRFNSTLESTIVNSFSKVLKEKGINKVSGLINIFDSNWETQYLPDGWIWQDVANYYGAGASGFNWRENQYDIILESGNTINDPVRIKEINPQLYYIKFISELKSAGKNTGDNAYIYFSTTNSKAIIRGTIPIGEKSFKISGAIPDPKQEFIYSFAIFLSQNMPSSNFQIESYSNIEAVGVKNNQPIVNLYSHYSPSLDSIIYWLNKKSINLYAEALLKTFAYEKKGFGSTEGGIEIVKDFWKQKGIDPNELNIYDGSGLSPMNRVTTHAQVEILKYAKKQNWFPYFFNSLPEYNGMSMKSGTIGDVKGFAGYHKAKNGKEYIFSFLVNNYNEKSSALVGKMYKVLNVLK